MGPALFGSPRNFRKHTGCGLFRHKRCLTPTRRNVRSVERIALVSANRNAPIASYLAEMGTESFEFDGLEEDETWTVVIEDDEVILLLDGEYVDEVPLG